MSKYIESLPNGRLRIECESEEGCRHKHNDMCCCEQAETLREYVPSEWCGTVCPYFEPEDMKEGEIRYE